MQAKKGGQPVRRRRTADQARRELLDGATAYAADVGPGAFSVRACAARLGTSHRLLLHHFGTREHLIAAVMAEMRERQLRQAAEDIARGAATPESAGRQMWRSFTADREALKRNLELVGLALLAPETYGDIVTSSTEQWIEGTKAMLSGRVPAARLDAYARAIVAGIGGLQIDLALSGDSNGVEAAYDALERMARTAT